MVCHQCGRVVADRDRFCGSCGAPLTDTCPRCGRSLVPAAAYCTGCGVPRAGPAPPGTSTEDRRRVSVLFVDLVGFTPYAELTDPELVRQTQRAFYAAARRAVALHGGVVEKYIGDAVMALFGAPIATETDALRCVLAGLELQRTLTARTPDGPVPSVDLRLRVGIATGDALVDVAAARDGGQAIVAGDVVNMAARMQSVAPAGGVLACARTYALTAGAIRYTAQPPVTLKGRTAPSKVWLALAAVPRPAPGQGAPDPTPLVAREHELGLLAGALRRAVSNRTPQLVTIVGQPGIGKSRLVRELRQRASEVAAAQVAWFEGHCPPFGENVTYAGLAEIVQAATGIRAAGTPQQLLQVVREVVAGPDAQRVADALAPLVGLAGAGLPGGPGEAGAAWRRFLAALATRGPTVLVFEDLHWADELLLRFVDLLATSTRDVPLLLVCTARPELVDREPGFCGTIAGSLAVNLRPLRSEDIALLYGYLLGPAAGNPDWLEPLVELANGNPLYAQEYARMVLDRSVVAPMPASWPGGPPDTVYAVIANRLDLLPAGDRAVLQAAAVVGVRFWPGAVAAALGDPDSPVERALRRLEQRGLVTEAPSTLVGQVEFRFGHVLVRDVCYRRLPRAERVARHGRAADWLEQWLAELPPPRDPDLAEVVAHHRWAAYELARTLRLPTGPHSAASWPAPPGVPAVPAAV